MHVLGVVLGMVCILKLRSSLFCNAEGSTSYTDQSEKNIELFGRRAYDLGKNVLFVTF